MVRSVASEIREWCQLRAGEWDTLLLGNGFSRGVSPRFAYERLVESAGLGSRLRAILKSCESTDFERGLLSIEHTLDVLGALERCAHDEGDETVVKTIEALDLIALRGELHDGLIHAVHSSHPKASDIDSDVKSDVRAALASMKDVFTTNYDLLPYWCLLDGGQLIDYFWSSYEAGLRFERSNAEDVASRRRRGATGTALYYLHGALHLRETADGVRTDKIRRDVKRVGHLLETITHRWNEDPDMLPLFVSEGCTELKVERIERSPYLKFASEQLAIGERDVVVFGAAFHEQDAHIWRSLCAGARKVAVSIYRPSGIDPVSHQEYMQKVQGYLVGCDLDFFWSDTHPLGALGPARQRAV